MRGSRRSASVAAAPSIAASCSPACRVEWWRWAPAAARTSGTTRPRVDEVLAVEPEPYLRERAERAASGAPVSVSVTHGGADRLPGEAEAFDAGVVALVLCTVPDQQSALAELYRVIRPGGELRFYEHVLAHSRWEARFQRFSDATFWPRLAGGCHLARDTTTAIERAGFRIETFERFRYSPAPFLPSDPHVLGVARRA